MASDSSKNIINNRPITYDRRMCETCLKRARVPGERFCGSCRNGLIKKMVESGYLPKVNDPIMGQVSSGTTANEDGTHDRGENGPYRRHSTASDVIENSLAQLDNAKSRPGIKVNSFTTLKSLIHADSILNQFTPRTDDTPERAARRIKYKFGNHVRFCKLYNGFVPKKIETIEEYRDTLKRALSVEVENRAANYAYLKLLDMELEKFEKQQEDEGLCYCIWLTVVNEMSEMSGANTAE